MTSEERVGCLGETQLSFRRTAPPSVITNLTQNMMLLEQLVRVIVSIVLLLVFFPAIGALTLRLGDKLDGCARQYRRYAAFVMKKLYDG